MGSISFEISEQGDIRISMNMSLIAVLRYFLSLKEPSFNSVYLVRVLYLTKVAVYIAVEYLFRDTEYFLDAWCSHKCLFCPSFQASRYSLAANLTKISPLF